MKISNDGGDSRLKICCPGISSLYTTDAEHFSAVPLILFRRRFLLAVRPHTKLIFFSSQEEFQIMRFRDFDRGIFFCYSALPGIN